MDNNRDEYNRGGWFAFVFSIGFCLVFFVYISLIHPRIDLKEIPDVIPSDAALTFEITKVEKPWVESPDVATYGQKVYKNNCAVCHGNEGKGDAPAGLAANPPARNFVEGKWRYSGTSDGLFATITNGSPGTAMASFKHLPKHDRWALVQFIRSITTNKVADDPAKLEAFAAKAD